jgi:hypothetical protein
VKDACTTTGVGSPSPAGYSIPRKYVRAMSNRQLSRELTAGTWYSNTDKKTNKKNADKIHIKGLFNMRAELYHIE